MVQTPPQAAEGTHLHKFLAESRRLLGTLPGPDRIILERFFDPGGDQHLVVHAPVGARINRAWGLALRKRFCRKFNFELQAAATENAVLISLGATHSFALMDVVGYLKSATVREVLIQALLDTPLYQLGFPVYKILGKTAQVTIGYRGSLALINEIANRMNDH